MLRGKFPETKTFDWLYRLLYSQPLQFHQCFIFVTALVIRLVSSTSIKSLRGKHPKGRGNGEGEGIEKKKREILSLFPFAPFSPSSPLPLFNHINWTIYSAFTASRYDLLNSSKASPFCRYRIVVSPHSAHYRVVQSFFLVTLEILE